MAITQLLRFFSTEIAFMILLLFAFGDKMCLAIEV